MPRYEPLNLLRSYVAVVIFNVPKIMDGILRTIAPFLRPYLYDREKIAAQMPFDTSINGKFYQVMCHG